MPLLLWLTACDGRPELDRAADATQTALLSRPATTPTEAGGDGPFAVAEAAILQGALPAAGPRTEITVLNPLTGQQIDIETAPGQTTYSLSLPSGLWVLSARDGDRQLPIRCPTNSENCDGLHVVLNVVAGQMVRGVDISAAPPSTAAAPGAEGALEPATIAGSIVYPPSLSADAAASFRASVFALDTTSGRNTELVLAPGQDTYSLSVPPGIWQVYSYLLNTQGEFRHAEIKCARAVVCAGGSLAQLSLEPGQTVVNVDVIYARDDVHAPGAIFPRERGEFKFGGQAHSFAQPAADQMRAAGLDWVKFQVHVGDSDGVQK
ncbi:MAG: hypothetical protein ACE5FI_15850, partial [Anaerolineales bacterium]